MKVKSKVKKVNSKRKTRWDHAIEDAQRLIRERQEDINGLRDSIQVFEARRNANAPWPGESATP